MPLSRRLPKRGFVNIFRKQYRIVNIERLNGFDAGSVVSPETLLEAGLLGKGRDDVKILGDGELSVQLTVRAHRFTKSAVKKIEAAGGTVLSASPWKAQIGSCASFAALLGRPPPQIGIAAANSFGCLAIRCHVAKPPIERPVT